MPASRRLGIALLAAFMFVNFWDRAALGFAAVPIMRDLHLTHSEFGSLGSAFYALFSVCAIVLGWLGDRRPLKWLIAGMALTWTAAQAIMVGAITLPQALASRVLLGAGEGGAFPTALHAAFDWLPKNARAWATAVVGAGSPIGIASGALAVTWAISAIGWRATFAALSCLSLAWCLAWIALRTGGMRANPAQEPATGERANFGRLDPAIVGTTVTAFGVYWVFAIATNWYPAVLQSAAGLSPRAAGAVLGIGWSMQLPAFWVAARAVAALRASGFPERTVLGAPALLGIVLSGAAIAAAAVAGKHAAPLFIIFSLGFVGVAVPCLPTIVADASRLRSRGVALGSFIGIASLAGLVAPFCFGAVIDAAGGRDGYRDALLISAIVVMLAAPVAYWTMRAGRRGLTSGY